MLKEELNKHPELYRRAFHLSIFTILYNFVEGWISVLWGFEDDTLALFGFGVDSFIEMMSGVGVAIMIMRIWRHPLKAPVHFETTALYITGIGFYVLTLGLVVSALHHLIRGYSPTSTIGGVVIACISIVVMVGLYASKLKVSRTLNSPALKSDASCILVCIYMSLILLASSVVYEFTGFGYVDSLGTLGLAYYSFIEGREAVTKAKVKTTNNIVEE
ncbi:cation transporter [Candidatus Jorgensenbacteria bacterium]|nr:cation transporter [Candidatus Jorgensenbacteria bacterium]